MSILTNPYGNTFTIVRFEGGATTDILALEGTFDCFVLSKSPGLSAPEIQALARTLATGGGQWIEVFGCYAERIHDAIDECAVAIGRQPSAGRGNPMTTWNDEPDDDDEIGSYIWTGGQGSSDRKVVLVIGDKDAEERVRTSLLKRGHPGPGGHLDSSP